MAKIQPFGTFTIQDALNYETVDLLKQLAKLIPLNKVPQRKAELMDAIAEHLQGNKLKALWEKLDRLQKLAVAEVVHGDREALMFDDVMFEAKYGEKPNWGEELSFMRGYTKEPSLLGLFFYTTSTYASIRRTMPQDLQERLKAFVPEPPPLVLESHPTLPNPFRFVYEAFSRKQRRYETVFKAVDLQTCETERTAQRDLLAVLRFVNLGKMVVSDKTLMPSKATIKAVTELLDGGDFYTQPDQTIPEDIGAIKAFAWPMILQAAGLAALDGKKLQLTKAGQKALNDDPAKSLRSAWKKWQKTRVLDELRRIEAIKGQTGKGQRSLTAVDRRRKAIHLYLQQIPLGEWVRMDNLERYIIASDQIFQVARSTEHLQLDSPYYGQLYDEADSWSILQSSYLACVLLEYAATMGLIDVAYIKPDETVNKYSRMFWGNDSLGFFSRYDGLLFIRLNRLGAYCLDRELNYDSASVTAESTLRVLPNLDVVLTGEPLTSADELMMEAFTEQKSDVVWHLDRKKILSAIADGRSLDQFCSFLEQASLDQLPDTVQQLFEDLQARSKSLVDKGLVRLIECADATLATQIANDSRTKKYCSLAGDRQLIVEMNHETRFRNALKKLGYTLPLT